MQKHDTIARWLAESQRAVVFTGAGISTESGVPDYRSPGGIWANSTPVYYQDFLDSAEARYEYWRQKSVSHRDFFDCEPNMGHRILAQWEQAGRILGIITQNIDGFHQAAGSQRVIELHGTAREIKCLECHQRYGADGMVAKFLREDRVPQCESCGGLLKHATISFGQSLEQETLALAVKLSMDADLFIALGSSLVVHPAASLPQLAMKKGAKLVIINRDPTPLDDEADLLLAESLGEALAEIDAALKK